MREGDTVVGKQLRIYCVKPCIYLRSGAGVRLRNQLCMLRLDSNFFSARCTLLSDRVGVLAILPILVVDRRPLVEKQTTK